MSEVNEITPPSFNEDEQTFGLLSELAATHIPQNPHLRIAKFDPENPLHKLETTRVEASSLSLDVAKEVAERFHPGFYEQMVRPFLEKLELLKKVSEILRNGENITIATGHESLMDIILTLLAHNIALAEKGYFDLEDITKKSEIIVSRTILCMEVDLNHGVPELESQYIPAIEMVRFCGNINFSLPRSKRIQASIGEKTINANNLKVMRQFKKSTKPGNGKVVGIAMPGTSDDRYYNLDGTLHHYVMGTVSEQTAKLVSQTGLILPVGVVMSGEKTCCVPGNITELKKDEAGSYQGGTIKLMGSIASSRTLASKVPTYYRVFDTRAS